ncbi:M10 family metallopeptidase C-terminal domain-containing protein [Methylobacterium sp. 77]|uniref:M10 family metallopeptidase C-terminal domain-containing protein n=1 Tax=Methylobacterium sp. 77 TaxID=1101192 RepID=UPI000371F47B|nr:M10 family metallopeptidase C-terminal domain-containing protein [Methylobacterium sp. 77]
MVSVVNATGNPDIDGILWGWKTDRTNITFSFPTSTAEYGSYTTINGFQAFEGVPGDDKQGSVRMIVGNLASFTNLTFTETTSSGAYLRFAQATSINYSNDATVAGHRGLHTISTAEANPPELAYNGNPPYSPAFAQGDSWYNPNNYDNPLKGTYQYTAGLMHETGHNLGLKHGHATQNGHGTTFPMLPSDHNSQEYSVMTYNDFVGDTDPRINSSDLPTTFMQDDIAALQLMYGANYGASAHNGDTTYTWSATTGEESIEGTGQGAPWRNAVFMTVWDGGGIDTYDFSNYTTNLSVDLAPGGWTILDTSSSHAQRAYLGNDGSGSGDHYARGNIANALIDPTNPTEVASLIENATGGSGNDTISGNGADNTLKGGGGNDTLYGLEGADTIYGDSIFGASGDDTLKGGGGADTLYGGGGTDMLKGGGGADTLDGGAGIDTADYSQSADGVTVDLTDGTGSGGDADGDTLTGIENIFGTTLADFLGGDEADNHLEGSSGADILKGAGGTDNLEGGADDDTLKGGGGADVLDGGSGVNTASYSQSSIGVVVNLRAGTGTGGDAQGDTYINIQNLTGSSGDDVLGGIAGANVLNGLGGNNTADYSLSPGAVTIDLGAGTASGGDAAGDTLIDIQNLTGSIGADSLTGDAKANILRGGDGADILNGAGGKDRLVGGTGDDTMSGGADDDIYFVDSAADRVLEAVGGGADRVLTSFSYILEAGQEIERLEVATATSVNAIDLTGNAFGNTLVGNDGSNRLDGMGGIDTLSGRGGSDTYIVDIAADKVVEAIGDGNDTVIAAVSFVLAAGQEIETLRTTNDTGTGAIDLTGNAFANKLVGNDGANVLDGGAGADSLYGKGGDDTFLVDISSDKVFETVGDGNDTVRASVSFVLAAGQEIETLRTTNDTGTGAIDLTGNAFANKLVGNDGANVLDGGAGADSLYGKGGDDTFFVGLSSDKVFEAVGDGNDTVRASVSFVLAAGQEIEALRTTSDTGTGAIDLTGNERVNKLVGNDGANILSGGTGADSLFGRGGADTFLYKLLTDSTVAGSGRDTLQDFSRTQGDRIDLHLIDAVAGGSVNQAFKFIGDDDFTQRAGELHAVASGANTLVSGDVDGDGTSDFSILLKSTITLHSADFIL